ncbi:LysR family transcriptional regulator [Agromyces sp. G08B096]|uniref:LysR family transcriptional regulator n=1 Tax=Agromyces sp. G08B096 TaxID=3156399 RepID=A0AAU7W2V1_9MICO
MARGFDLIAACTAFVAVAERESFTAGALGAGITQSVASRRVAALEAHVGGRLFDRSSRQVALTEFGRRILPAAQRLVAAADDLVDEVDDARRAPVPIAVPRHLDPALGARLSAAVAGAMTAQLVESSPRERDAWVADGRVRLALQHVEPDRAAWSRPLGVAGIPSPQPHDPGASPPTLFLSELRPRRGGGDRRVLWIQPEDDVPHVRDRVERARNAAGLTPGLVRVADALVWAAARAMIHDDLVLCTPDEAGALGLEWRPLGDLHLRRGYAVTHRDPDLAARFTAAGRAVLAALFGDGSVSSIDAR